VQHTGFVTAPDSVTSKAQPLAATLLLANVMSVFGSNLLWISICEGNREVPLIVPPLCVKVGSGNLSRHWLPHEGGKLRNSSRTKRYETGWHL
jgi:hypothetical protein